MPLSPEAGAHGLFLLLSLSLLIVSNNLQEGAGCCFVIDISVYCPRVLSRAPEGPWWEGRKGEALPGPWAAATPRSPTVFSERSHVGTGGPAPAGSCNSYLTPGSQRRPLLIELSLVLGVSFFPLKGNPRRMFLSSSSLKLSLACTEGLVTEEIKGVSFKW